MITAERLKELIKSNASVYDFIEEQYVPLNSTCFVDEKVGALYWFKEDFKDDDWFYPLEDLFETKEEAEWELEFGNITRTETLRLPTWEEFLKDNFGIKFYYKSREFHLHKVRYSVDDNNPQWKINIYEDYCDDCDTVAWEKEWDLTKENYIEACRLAKKLFIGEKQ